MYGRLNLMEARTVAGVIQDALHEAGFEADEAIAGCVQAIVELADDDTELLDGAANLLADGGI